MLIMLKLRLKCLARITADSTENILTWPLTKPGALPVQIMFPLSAAARKVLRFLSIVVRALCVGTSLVRRTQCGGPKKRIL